MSHFELHYLIPTVSKNSYTTPYYLPFVALIFEKRTIAK